MNATWTHRDSGFVIGLLTGACVGAGLAIWLAPRLASALGQQVFDSARNLGQRAAEQSQRDGTRVGEALDELVRTARGLRHFAHFRDVPWNRPLPSGRCALCGTAQTHSGWTEEYPLCAARA